MSKVKTMMNACYECDNRRTIPGDCHSACANKKATVTGNSHGIRSGWFTWPYNFDPVWLESCDGFKKKTLSQPKKEDEK